MNFLGLQFVVFINIDEQADVLHLKQFVNSSEGLAHQFVVNELQIFYHINEEQL